MLTHVGLCNYSFIFKSSSPCSLLAISRSYKYNQIHGNWAYGSPKSSLYNIIYCWQIEPNFREHLIFVNSSSLTKFAKISLKRKCHVLQYHNASSFKVIALCFMYIMFFKEEVTGKNSLHINQPMTISATLR